VFPPALARFDAYAALIIDPGEVPQIDFTSGRAVDDMLRSALDSGRDTFIVGCRAQVSSMLKKQGVFDKFSEDELEKNRLDALKTALSGIKARQSV
jgi:MFS superfamily sulfate permease-like transporter